MYLKVLIFLCIFNLTISEVDNSAVLSPSDIVFVILSQNNAYHEYSAVTLKKSILHQSTGLDAPKVYISHLDFQHAGDWTIFPLISNLNEIYGNISEFVFFIQDYTFVNLEKLLEVLLKYKGTESFLGYPLHDEESTIIHHYKFNEDPKKFKYPLFAAGFAISKQLLNNLSERLTKEVTKNDFNIDSSHELALYIWNKGNGVKLIGIPAAFCTAKADSCATYVENFIPCDEPVDIKTIYFAVKTHFAFHKTRVKIVQQTWAPFTSVIKFFSDSEDLSIPTVNLNVKNVERGHCAKTFAIFKYVFQEIQMKNIKWIALVDDDTIISPKNLAKYLSCFDPATNVIIGERYGFNAHKNYGYNYITGGGGTIISSKLLQLIVNSNCQCPKPDTPDDMYLGFCLANLGVPLVHSSLFHQARPEDYAKDYLGPSDNIISFHKHWMNDPIEVFNTWFKNHETNHVENLHEDL